MGKLYGKIKAGWENTVGENDTVLVAGDISWAMNAEELKPDFDFIEALPGKKSCSRAITTTGGRRRQSLINFLRQADIKPSPSSITMPISVRISSSAVHAAGMTRARIIS